MPDAHIQHAYYRLYAFVDDKRLKAGWSRDRIMNQINALGVPCFSGSCPEIYNEKAFDAAKTLIWNGPLGAFEIEPFDAATTAAARKVAQLTKAGQLVSVAGGGDTIAALNHAGVSADFSYVSTAGGAFLEWMEGKTLPGVAALIA